MSYASEITSDLAEIASDMGTTCTIGVDVDIACAASFTRRGEEIEYGGKVVTIQLTLIVSDDVLTGDAPSIGSVVTYQSTSYRLARRRNSPTQTHYEIDLIDLSEKR